MKNNFAKCYWLLALLGTLAFLNGCASDNHDQPETDLPWAQPASWESTPGAIRSIPNGVGGLNNA
jgi:hypothetical protein